MEFLKKKLKTNIKKMYNNRIKTVVIYIVCTKNDKKIEEI